MRKMSAFFLLTFLIFNFAFGQSFKINIENTPSDFNQYWPHLTTNGAPFFVTSWQDTRLGPVNAFAQLYDSRTFRKIGANFPILGQNLVKILNDSLFLCAVERDYESLYSSYYLIKGQIYNQNKVYSDSFLIESGDIPVCGMGYFGKGFFILPVKDSFVILKPGAEYFYIRRFYFADTLRELKARHKMAVTKISAAAFANGDYAMVFFNDAFVDGDSLFAAHFIILDNRDSIKVAAQKIDSVAYPSKPFWEFPYDLATCSVNDTTVLVAFLDMAGKQIKYAHIFQSGRWDSLQTILLNLNMDNYDDEMRFIKLNDGSIRLLLSGRNSMGMNVRPMNAFLDFGKDGIFKNLIYIDTGLFGLVEKGCIFKDNNTFYSVEPSEGDVFLNEYSRSTLVSSTKINDDSIGSNEQLKGITPYGSDFFTIYKDELGFWGRKVHHSGYAFGNEIRLHDGINKFFSDYTRVELWRTRSERYDYVQLALFDATNRLIKMDTIATVSDEPIIALGIHILSNDRFLATYQTYDQLYISYYDKNLNALATFQLKATNELADPFRFFTMKDQTVWMSWGRYALKLSPEPQAPLSEVKAFESGIALIFDPGLFLLKSDEIQPYGWWRKAILITIEGDTLTPPFSIVPPRPQYRPFLVPVSGSTFLSLYHLGNEVSCNVFDLAGRRLIDQKLIVKLDSGIVRKVGASINGNNIAFVWQRNGRSGCGYDVDGLVLPVSEFTAIGKPGDSNPFTFRLEQNYPNPFNSSTVIPFELPGASDVTLTIYNILGQKIYRWHKTFSAAGSHQILWDGRNFAGSVVPSGVYFYRLKANTLVKTRKLIFIR